VGGWGRRKEDAAHSFFRLTESCIGYDLEREDGVWRTTGQYPARWKITSYLAERQRNAARGMANWLDPQAFTFARALQKAGYATGHFGKWHMGGQRDVGDAPLITEYGFETSLTQFDGLGDRILPLLDMHNGQPPEKYGLGSDQLGRGKITWMDRSAMTGAFTARTIEFIKKTADEGRPFYVNLWPDDVHAPLFPPGDSSAIKDSQQRYLRVMEAMDSQLAPLFDYLRANPQVGKNTIVIVTSDNGPVADAGSTGSLRGRKTVLYEGGIREPLIVWAPGRIHGDMAGRTNSTSWFSAIDVARSLLKLANVDEPAGTQLDGEDVSGTLVGEEERSRTRPLFWGRPSYRRGWDEDQWPDVAVRDGSWKLLCQDDGSRGELFDLINDPRETTNLAEKHSDVATRLTRAATEWAQTIGKSPAK
jgi:arylsulfatase A-like enzyme